MLRISRKADYAVFVLGAIARQGAYPGGPAEDSVVSAQEISRQAGLNKSVVANLLKEFAKHGLLVSVRGLKGGYRLGREPRSISLGEILEVVEGRFTLVDCIPHDVPLPTRAIQTDGREPTGDGAANGAATRSAGAATGAATHECSLIAFCPSKSPMRLVHERIARLFDEIRLDELCSLRAHTAAAAVHAEVPAVLGMSTHERFQR